MVDESWRRANPSDGWAANWLLIELTPILAQRAPQLLAQLVHERNKAEVRTVIVEYDRVLQAAPY